MIMSFKASNYAKTTPTRWQVAGDLALVLIPVLLTVVNNSTLAPETQSLINFWMSSVLAIVKVLSQFFSDEP